MTLALLKRQCVLWIFTSVGVLLVFLAGLLVSLWLSSQPPLVVEGAKTNPLFTLWRTAIYTLLLLFWPRCFNGLMRNKSLQLSRRPLIALIVLYEGLIVHSPLAVLLRWIG